MIISIIAYTIAFCCIVLGIFAYLQDTRKIVNRLFFIMTISLSGFIFLTDLCFFAVTKENLRFFYKLASFFFSSYFVINLHFNIIITKNKLKLWKCLLLYIPVPVLIYLTVFDYSLFSDFIFHKDHWDFIPAYGTFGFYFYNIYFLSYTIASLLVVEIFRRRASSNKEKRQAVIINTGYFISMLIAHLSALILPRLYIFGLSAIIPNILIIYLAVIFFAVFRLKFMDLTPSIMADEIIENISDMILLLDTDYKIKKTNSLCAEILKLSTENAQQKSFFSIISVRDELKGIFDRLLKSVNKSTNCSLAYPGSNDIIFTDTYISKIFDRFNDLTGFLVISRENKSKSRFQEKYKITGREFEIIDLVLSGQSANDIGHKLGISKRTVETHCLNVYTKLGIRDRMELYNLAGEYNLIPKH
jgi:DNA-binding CsgD family transcriptional regulator